MLRPDLAGSVAPPPPSGCRLVESDRDDLTPWRQLLTETLGDARENQRGVRRWTIHAGEEFVGGAATWRPLYLSEQVGYLGVVGVRQDHRGRGIGRALVGACLEGMRQEGRQSARLDTEDGRDAAIRLFLAMGFVPDPESADEWTRWVRVARRLGRDDLAMAMGD